MDNDKLKTLAAKELSAMKASLDITSAAIGQIRREASHPALKAALEKGCRAVSEWDYRLEHAIREIGGAEGADRPILLAHYEASRERRQSTTDSEMRDLAIISGGQFALHYWMSAFGTMAQYAKRLGFNGVAWNMNVSAEEAKIASDGQAPLIDNLLRDGLG